VAREIQRARLTSRDEAGNAIPIWPVMEVEGEDSADEAVLRWCSKAVVRLAAYEEAGTVTQVRAWAQAVIEKTEKVLGDGA